MNLVSIGLCSMVIKNLNPQFHEIVLKYCVQTTFLLAENTIMDFSKVTI